MKEIGVRLHTDSTAAKSIGGRQGVGKIKQLDIESLWLQQVVRYKRVAIHKVNTIFNKADLGTKVHPEETFTRLCTLNGYLDSEDLIVQKEEKAVKVTGHIEKKKPDKANATKITQLLTAALTLAQGSAHVVK